MPPKKRVRDEDSLDDTPNTGGSWSKVDSVFLLSSHPKPKENGAALKIASFDMDDTLVKPKDGRTFPKNRTDWVWADDCVPAKLKKLHSEGYWILIMSNQNGIEDDAAKAGQVKGKINDLITELGIPISAALATGKDEYRKPEKKLWELVQKELLHGLTVDYKNSYYVGDAAGRTILTMAKRKKDFSCGDLKFSLNAGLPFHTPEFFFLGLKEAPVTNWDGPSPDELKALPKTQANLPEVPEAGPKEVVIMVGYPGSGKSTFYRRYFEPKGYVHVNRDTLKTPEKCMKAVEAALQSGKSCVVDNTSPGKADRAKYIGIAKKLGVPVRCYVMLATAEMASHLNAVRMRLGGPRVSSMAYKMFKKNFEEVNAKTEGIAEVIEVQPTANFTGLGDQVSALFYELSG